MSRSDESKEAPLRADIRRLGDLLGHQRRFIRDASHQLKTPLAVMKIQLQLAQRGGPSDPHAR